MEAADLVKLIRDIPDFPEPGILFKDITPVLADGAAFRTLVEALASTLDASEPEVVVGIEARGFVLAAPVAAQLGIGFVPVRKKGKLPHQTVEATYALEYGTATVEVHADGIVTGSRVAVIDDVLATGGTAEATCELLERLGGRIVAVSFFLELAALNGRAKLADRPVHALLTV